MIHRCPVCGARYGHTPDCPFRKYEAAERYVWGGCIGLAAELVLLFACRL